MPTKNLQQHRKCIDEHFHGHLRLRLGEAGVRRTADIGGEAWEGALMEHTVDGRKAYMFRGGGLWKLKRQRGLLGALNY